MPCPQISDHACLTSLNKKAILNSQLADLAVLQTRCDGLQLDASLKKCSAQTIADALLALSIWDNGHSLANKFLDRLEQQWATTFLHCVKERLRWNPSPRGMHAITKAANAYARLRIDPLEGR